MYRTTMLMYRTFTFCSRFIAHTVLGKADKSQFIEKMSRFNWIESEIDFSRA